MITPTISPAMTAIAAFIFPNKVRLSAREAIITSTEAA